LHNADYYSQNYTTGDMGGNLINVTNQIGNIVNLHAFWDSVAGELNVTYTRPLNESSMQWFENYSLGLMEEYPRSNFAADLNVTSPN